MNLEDYTDERIFDDFNRLQYLYKLKEVTRYNQDRHETDSTESVAEHLYGMMLLTEYFLPFEDPEGKLDKAKIFEMILFHDIDEIETGDVLGYRKTEADRARELDAMKRVLAGGPLNMQELMTARVEEYEAKETPEAKFAKAMDKVEPLVQIFNEKWKQVLVKNKTTAEESLRIKTPYIGDFPYVKKFSMTIHDALVAQGFFWSES